MLFLVPLIPVHQSHDLNVVLHELNAIFKCVTWGKCDANVTTSLKSGIGTYRVLSPSHQNCTLKNYMLKQSEKLTLTNISLKNRTVAIASKLWSDAI